MTQDPMKAERDFYDETDLDYPNMRRVPLRRATGAAPLSTFAVRLEADAIDDLRRLAAGRGLGPTQLARTWILERLAAERGEATTTPAAAATALRDTLEPLVRAAVAEELADRLAGGLTDEGAAALLAALESAVAARDAKPATNKPMKKAATKPSASR